MTLQQLLLINFGALLTAIGGVFLKRLSIGLQDQSTGLTWLIQALFNPYLWAGAICYVIPVSLWAYLLRDMELTKLQPMLAIVYLYTILFAYMFLGEQPSTLRLLGIGLVAVGVALVGRT